MKTRMVLAGLMSVCVVALLAGQVVSEDKQNVSPDQQQQMAKQMEAWMRAALPGPQHARLQQCVGSWQVTCTMWNYPGAEPNVTTATSEIKMIMGGRYVQESYRCSMPMPFEGMSILGYDNLTKKYNSIWIDNMGTGIMYMTGDYDEKTKTMTMVGDCVDPMTGEKMRMRNVGKEISKDEQAMEMFNISADGKEFKSMEFRYVRQQPKS